jgi:hypothetical protein
MYVCIYICILFFFSCTPRPALGPTQPHIQWVPGLFPRPKAAGAWRYPPIPIQCRGYTKSRDKPLLPLWDLACFRANFTFVTRLVTLLFSVIFLLTRLYTVRANWLMLYRKIVISIVTIMRTTKYIL